MSTEFSESSIIPHRKAAAIKVSLPLAPVIHEALQGEAVLKQRELTEHIQRLLAEHLIKEDLLKPSQAYNLQLKWRLVDRAVEVAQEICRSGEFSSKITLDAIRTCMKNPEWVAGYREFVGDDIYKNGNWLKGEINPEIGYRIRAGIGGRTVRKADGKAATVKVLGEIIQSYTPMQSFDSTAVELKAGGT